MQHHISFTDCNASVALKSFALLRLQPICRVDEHYWSTLLCGALTPKISRILRRARSQYSQLPPWLLVESGLGDDSFDFLKVSPKSTLDSKYFYSKANGQMDRDGRRSIRKQGEGTIQV